MRLPDPVTIHSNAPFAASEMASYLEKITGRPPVPKGGFPIHIQAANSLENDAYRIEITEQALYIKSQSLRGAAYAVYDFLENDLGCAFYAEDCEAVPRNPSPRLSPGSRTQTPAFAYRDVYWRGALDGRFALKSRLNSARADIPPAWGGPTGFYNYSHTFEELVPPETHFGAHPEYFSMIDGQRQRDKSQLCLTNPEVLALCTEGVRGWMRAHPDCTIFSVAQNDWYSPCACPECAALDAAEGSHAGTLIHFVNRIADAIAAEFPHNNLHTFAYLYTRKAPRRVRPRPNVIVRLCTIECCFSHPLSQCVYAVDDIDVEDTSARTFRPTEKLFLHDLQAWSACCGQLYLWDYTTNFANYLQPFPNLHVLQPNLRLFHAHGVKGVFEQGNYAPGSCSAFGALKIYLLGKLLWDPDANVPRLTEAFVRGYYGPGATNAIFSYLSLMEHAARQGHMCIFDGAQADYLGDETLQDGAALMEQAAAAAKMDGPDFRKRVLREQLSVRYMQLVRLPLETPGRDARIEAFARDAHALGIGELFERRALLHSFDCMKKSLYAADREDVPYAVYRL